ncbi:pogo transposable element with KRAB domain [Rhizophagus irregularis DAOM 181602=DAOM 197198]|nr:pogo transposable element with KRAB domain [Rhizophagus irregularis DAOM 181602=DAOM 197198]GBC26366.1 pogo transposable element with KRAB domain [Rhizophagus irregularis DAOM 181602=DAOM 197198]GBC35806.2 pogo transposable element with KRAB domain [Rhizophagus irregularis DAOM 181602=DAOM 197198]GBC38422.2 pogo transposable element with KRAB domain [Rhizophagus irregularis DAOM 181602=DAOM 197198]GBC41716.2 pogo transposable element with KRAB domain [Rhizophagus irregularis DAOM 181602=DAOM
MPQVSKRQRSSYSIEQKKIVVAYAKERGRNEASRHFELDASMVGRWVKASLNWKDETKATNMSVGSGRKAFYPEAEVELYKWVMEQRKMALAITTVNLRISMFEILDRPEMISLYGNSIETFKATSSWLSAFMKRYKLALRRRTKVSQKLPEQTEELLEKFRRFVIRIRVRKSFELCNIFNMDETPVWFDMAGNFTIHTKGDKTIHIRGTGNEKNRFTVVLTCAADGTKFPAICIFKGKQMPRGEQAPSGVIVWFQESGWMNTDLMKRGHLEESVKNAFHDTNVDLAVIPGGLTSICQPLDVAINKPFKDNLRKEWHHWMSNGGAGYTTSGNLRRAKISDVCKWVKRAWENISDDIIIRSFKKCGISNDLDGSEDDLVYEEIDELLKELQDENEEMDEIDFIDTN